MRYVVRHRIPCKDSVLGFRTGEIPCKTIGEARLLQKGASPEEKAVVYDTVRKTTV